MRWASPDAQYGHVPLAEALRTAEDVAEEMGIAWNNDPLAAEGDQLDRWTSALTALLEALDVRGVCG